MKTVLACRNPQSLEDAINTLYENGYDKVEKDRRKYCQRSRVSKKVRKQFTISR